MKDNFSPQDEEIIRQLKNLDRAAPEYPANTLQKRRDSFRKAADGLIMGIPAAGLLKGRFGSLGHLTARTLEIILIGTLLVEAGVGAYLFRDQIREWFMAETSKPVVLQSTWTPRPTRTETPSPTPTMTATLTFPTANLKTPPPDQGLHLGQTKTPKP